MAGFPADKRIFFFSPEESEGDQTFRNTLGGKGANLAEMCVNRLFLPAAPGGSAQPWLVEEEHRGWAGGRAGGGGGGPGWSVGALLARQLRHAPSPRCSWRQRTFTHTHHQAAPGLTTARPLCRSKIGLPVPAGFTITCETCMEYQK